MLFPYLRTSVAVGTAMVVGDVACQNIAGTPYDAPRTLRMGITGAFVSAPVGHKWMHVLEGWFPGKSMRAVLCKVAGNAAFSPVGISLAFTSLTLLEGKTLSHAKAKIKADLPITFMTGACYWPFVSFLSFRYVPLDYRAITGSIAGAIWNTYLSSQANRPVELEPSSVANSTTSEHVAATVVPVPVSTTTASAMVIPTTGGATVVLDSTNSSSTSSSQPLVVAATTAVPVAVSASKI